MPKLKRLEVARVGSRPCRAGTQINLKSSDLRELAESYSPHLHQCKVAVNDVETAIALGAPAVLGHLDPRLVETKGALPAFGRVLEATASDESLFLDLELTDSLAGWIKDGLYDHVSVSWYDRTDPRNPTPGKLHLRHIGWLGAEPSAMKDLRLPSQSDIEWSESNVYLDDNNSLTTNIKFIEFAENIPMDEELMMDAGQPAEESTVDPVLMLISILQDGPKGYKGEITEFRPQPTEENTFLWDEEAQQFAGQFVDASDSEEEVYDFTLALQPDGSMIRSYKKVLAEDEETGPIPDQQIEAEADLADQPVEMGEYRQGITLSESEYAALTSKAALADALMEEKEQLIKAQKAEKIANALSPLYEMGLIDPYVDSYQVADAIIKLCDWKEGDYYELEFSEGQMLESPLDTVVQVFQQIGKKAKTLNDTPIEFGEMSFDSPANYGFSPAPGTMFDPGQASVDSRARAIIKENGWDASNNKDYLKAVKLAMGS